MTHSLLALTLPPAARSRRRRHAPHRHAGGGHRAGRRALRRWLGCWRLEDDLAGTGARICITPETATACAADRSSARSKRHRRARDCPTAWRGRSPTRSARAPSRPSGRSDGARVFRYTDVTCGKEAPRNVSSVAFLTHGPVVDQRAVRRAARREHERARAALSPRRRPEAGRRQHGAAAVGADAAARRPPDRHRWNIEDVIEASGKLPAEAVQAALTEVHTGPST